MAWDQGSIVSETPWDVFIDKVKAMCGQPGVANWSFVTTLPAGTEDGQSGHSDFTAEVFKCASDGTDGHGFALNHEVYSPDFYVTFLINIDNIGLSYGVVHEEFDAHTGLFRKYCPWEVFTGRTTVGDGHWVGAVDWMTPYDQGTRRIYRVNLGPLVTSGFQYGIKMTNRTLDCFLRVDTDDYMFHASLIDSTVIGEDPLPLCVGGNDDYLGFSNEPYVDQTYRYLGMCAPRPLYLFNAVSRSTIEEPSPDVWNGSSGHLFRLCVLRRDNRLMTDGSIDGRTAVMRGLLPNTYLGTLNSTSNSSARVGDSIIIDAVEWVILNKFTDYGAQWLLTTKD